VTRPRVTSTYAKAVERRLSDRDRAIIATLDVIRIATGEQLQRLHVTDASPASNARHARRILERLVQLRVLARLERDVGGVRAGSSGFIYCLDSAGQHIASGCGPAGGRRLRRPWTPSLPFLTHNLLVSELFVGLHEQQRRADGGLLELVDFQAEPLCWRRYTGPSGGQARLKPDAFVRTAVPGWEHVWFIEIDRGTQSAPTIARKLAAYRAYWRSGREQARWVVFPKVLFLAPSAARKAVLVDVAAAQPQDSWPLWQVAPYTDAITVLAGGTP
jgi:hypothetical protein